MTDHDWIAKLHFAVQENNLPAAEEALRNGADPNNTDGCTIRHACMDGNPKMIGLLLDHGGNVNLYGLDGATPLTWAAGAGQNAAVQYLIDRGAKVDAWNG